VTAAPGQDDPARSGRPRRTEPVVVVDVSGLCVDHPDGSFSMDRPGTDLAVVAALARMRLAARRTGNRVRLRGAAPELRQLLELTGLAGEFEWEPEEGEEAGGVQE
jgi:hypothetical protein